MFLLTITNPTILLVQEENRFFHRMGLQRIETQLISVGPGTVEAMGEINSRQKQK